MSGVENPLIRAALCAAARPCRDNDREGKEITDDRTVVKDRPRADYAEIRDNFLRDSSDHRDPAPRRLLFLRDAEQARRAFRERKSADLQASKLLFRSEIIVQC